MNAFLPEIGSTLQDLRDRVRRGEQVMHAELSLFGFLDLGREVFLQDACILARNFPFVPIFQLPVFRHPE